MASNIGSLVVSLEANMAKFQSDLGKAAAEAEKRARQMDAAFGFVKSSLAALGVGFAAAASFGAIKDKIEGVIQAAAGLQQLSERTGATVEALSGLAAVAKLSDTNTDSMAVGLQKLSKSMIDAENGGQKTSASFAAIGISVKDLQGKRPEQVFQAVSTALAGYKDGAEKVVIAQNLLGKSGADLLPLMKDLADVGELQVKTTAEQAAQADEYEKNLKRLQASTDAIFKKIGLELVPVFNAFTKALLETQNANDGIRKSVDDLAKDGSIREWAENAARAAGFVMDAFDGVSRVVQIAGKSIGATAAAAVAVAHGEFSQAVQIQKAYFADVDQILNRQLFSERLNRQLATIGKGSSDSGAQRKTIDTSGLGNANKGPADDPAKALLAGQLKAQESFIAAEKTQLQNREQMLQYFYSLDYTQANDYFGGKKQLITDSLQATLAAYDKEAAALTVYIAQAKTLTDAQQARNQLADVATKRAAAEAAANKQLTDVMLEQARVYREFDLATTALAHQHELANAQVQLSIDLLGKSTLEVQKITAARQLQVALEERLYQMRNKNLPQAEMDRAVVETQQQQAAALALIEQAYNRQRTAAFGAGEAMRKYYEDATNAAMQVENVMTNAFKGMEDALTSFITTGKLDFRTMADSIVADITRMIIKAQILGPLAKAIGGGASDGGGAGGFITSILGALAGGGPKAAGGPVFGGQTYLVGEKGPELFTPAGAGTIIPNGAVVGSGGNTVNVTVNQSFPPGTSRATTLQAAADARRQLEYSARNL